MIGKKCRETIEGAILMPSSKPHDHLIWIANFAAAYVSLQHGLGGSTPCDHHGGLLPCLLSKVRHRLQTMATLTLSFGSVMVAVKPCFLK